MKKIEIFEKAMNKGGSLKDYGINSTLFAAYRDCQETGNDNIDFNGVIWDYDIPEIVKALKENGISKFTISSTFSSLIETLAAFEKSKNSGNQNDTLRINTQIGRPLRRSFYYAI